VRGGSRQAWVLAAPALAFTVLAFAGPMVLVVATSLWRRVGAGIDTTPTLANYARAFGDPVYVAALTNSLEVVSLTILVSIVIAYPFAYIVATDVRERWQGPLLLLLVLPFWTSYVVRSYSWLLVLSRNGVVNRSLVASGLLTEPLTLANTRLGTVTAFVHFFTMVLVLTIYASLRQIPPTLVHAARDLGASAPRAFVRVTLPLSLPGVVVGAFLTFVLAIGDFVTPQIVGGGNDLLLPQAILLQVQRRGDFPLAAALAVVLLAIVAVVTAAAARHFTLEPRR